MRAIKHTLIGYAVLLFAACVLGFLCVSLVVFASWDLTYYEAAYNQLHRIDPLDIRIGGLVIFLLGVVNTLTYDPEDRYDTY